jgi:MFS family permease
MTRTRGPHMGWLLAVLLTSLFMTQLDTTIVNVAAPSIRAGLRASGGELELVVSGYFLAYAMLLITGARLGDMRGYRRVFLAGLGLFTLASLACGLAPAALALILARLAQGVGAALMVPQVLSGIQLHFSGPARARAVGLYAVALSGGAVAGQILGGVLLVANLVGSGWRPIFLINVPIGLAVLAVAARSLPADPGGRPRRLDLWGVAMLSATVLLTVLPLVLGRDQGWPAWTWVCLVASLPALGAFIAWERGVATRGGYPLIDLHILTRSAVSWGLIAYAAANGTYYALLFTLALYLQQGLGKSPLYSGLALVSWVAAFGLAGLLLRRLPARLTPVVAPIGYVIMAASYLGISASLFADHTGGALLIALLGCGGLGLGTGFTLLIAHLIASVPSRYAPDISGLITTTAQIAGVSGVATFGTAYLSLAPHAGPHPAMRAFTLVAAGFALTALLAAAAAYQSTHRPTATAAVPDHSDAANHHS